MAVQASRAGSGSALTRSAGAALGRGVLLALLAAAIGVLLLAYALDGESTDQVATGGGTATTEDAATTSAPEGGTDTSQPATTETPPPASTATTHAPANVTILVLNGNGVAGVAGANAAQLTPKGFVASATDAPATVDTTVVYYLDLAFQPDAAVVAETLGIDPAQVLPLADPATAGIDPKGSSVVVLLGKDGKHFRPS
jgi:hypothetical protein